MLTEAIAYLQSRVGGDKGATMVEYGIMVALIAVISVGIIGTLGGQVFDAFTNTSNGIAPAAN